MLGNITPDKKMDKKRSNSVMLISTIIMGVLALILLFIGYYRGQAEHISGIKSALNMGVQILPLLILAFIVAGMVQVLLPRELMSKWIGEESGFRGILIGTLGGALTPGGPFVSMPIAASVARSSQMKGWV